jgi:hypothetical protein
VKRVKKLAKRKNGLNVRHPGVIRGHKDCQQDPQPVPKNMGWLWNVRNLGIKEEREGWKPGAITKTVAKLMSHFLKPKPPAAEPEMAIEPKSTLNVQKKAGEYTIIMNPKNKKDKSCGDGPCPPIIFKITKNDEAKQRFLALREMAHLGIDKNCLCASIEECECMNSCEKLLLARELKIVSKKFGICPALTWNDLDELNESEMNFEFTPPCDMAKSKKVIRVSNEETQYELQSIEKCPSSIYEEEIEMIGKYQLMNKRRGEKLQRIKQLKEAKELREAKAREEAEKKKAG